MKHFILLPISLLVVFLCQGQVVQHQPSPAAKAYFQQAQTKYVKYLGKKDSMAIVFNLLDKAIKADNQYYDAWASKIAFQCQLDEFAPAYTTTQKMVALFPSDIYINLIFGALQYKNGHRNEAMVSYGKVQQLCDAVPEKNRKGDRYNETLSYKGVALVLSGKTNEGKAILRKLYNNEDNPVIKSRLAHYIDYTTKDDLINDVLPGRWD